MADIGVHVSSSPFAYFPTELILQAFELAASKSIQDALSLSLVSTWSRDLATPYIYGEVILRSATCTRSLSEGARELEKRTIRSPLVAMKKLYVPSSKGNCAADLAMIICGCMGLEELAMAENDFMDLLGLDAETWPSHNSLSSRRIRLTITPALTTSPTSVHELEHPSRLPKLLLGSITHLCFYPSAWTAHLALFLSRLPSLTHLAVRSYTDPISLLPIQSALPHLPERFRQLVVLVENRECVREVTIAEWLRGKRAQEPRLAINYAREYVDYMLQFRMDVKDEYDVWARAETDTCEWEAWSNRDETGGALVPYVGATLGASNVLLRRALDSDELPGIMFSYRSSSTFVSA